MPPTRFNVAKALYRWIQRCAVDILGQFSNGEKLLSEATFYKYYL